MKPYMVCIFNAGDMLECRIPNFRPPAGVSPFCLTPVTREGHSDLGENNLVWFFDDETSAEAFAKVVAERYPSKNLLVGKTLRTYKTTPGPVVGMAYTDRGLLPI